MKEPDHILVIFAAFVVALIFYAVVFIWTDQNPKFIEGAAVTLGGAIAGFAGRSMK